MFNVIIADLEQSHTLGIKSYIDTNFLQFKIKNTFSNEKDFYKYIKNNSIDLIIMEIRFLGLEFFKKMSEITSLYKDVKFIVYGSVSDINYLEKALELGAVSYTIRPVKPVDLNKCLSAYLDYIRVKETLIKEEKLLSIEYVQNFKLFEDKFLSVLINESIFDKDEIKESLEYFNINITPPYTVAVFRIDSFRKHIINKSQKEKHITIFKLLKIINSNIYNAKAFINLFNEIVIILGGENEIETVLDNMTNIKQQIKQETDISVSCGLGRTYEQLDRIHTSFLEATTALRYRCIVGYNSIIAIEYVEPENTFTATYPYERERLLVYTSVIGEYEYCLKLLNEIFEQINLYKHKFEEILPQIIMSILISINRNAFEQGLKIKPINNFFDTSKVFSLKTTNDAHIFLKDNLKIFCEYINDFRKNIEDEVFENAIKYINENYFKNINYKNLSRQFNYNIKYFKQIFEKRTEKHLDEYITRIRIDKAKELILTTNLTDDIVALKIGYEDVNVFRQTFKRLEGILAGDFRYINKDLKK
ncbi:helix-turn-helix domain-containing protein [uncultured Tyzzerella sp.]|uniref:response regulator transcription factor n=1 Tax=uncultured Tyzzerella sp. TaxID=2321398 RepID=UPI0029425A11|nr:helix-turn-helix domain-containing protein [uncultured Tyzzerella sp.]